jgi:hypothetical protein
MVDLSISWNFHFKIKKKRKLWKNKVLFQITFEEFSLAQCVYSTAILHIKNVILNQISDNVSFGSVRFKNCGLKMCFQITGKWVCF